MLDKALEKVGIKDAKIYLHCSDIARQHDKSNCGIFSIRDLVKMSQHGEEVVDWIEKHGESAQNNKFYEFTYLPPSLMKVATFKHIRKYEKAKGEAAKLKDDRKPSDTSQKHKTHTLMFKKLNDMLICAEGTRDRIFEGEINGKIADAYLKI